MNEACCAHKPTIESDYKAVGKWMDFANLKTYYVGTSTPSSIVIFVPDVFGQHANTLLGADLTASLMPESIVIVPDFFDGKPFPENYMSLSEEEQGKVRGEFFKNNGDFGKAREKLYSVAAAASEKFPGKPIASIGFCWGGKVTAVGSAKGTPLKVAGTAHPGRLDDAEAAAMVIPYICLLSEEDGSQEVRDSYEKALKSNGQDVHVETYSGMIHGWMAGRADLSVEKNRQEFDRGFKSVVDFFKKHL